MAILLPPWAEDSKRTSILGRPAPPRSVPTGFRPPIVSRRRLQMALGCLWLLDGALQLQPYMFTLGFAHNVIAPAAVGQPLFVGGAVRWSAALIATHPVVYDALFAAIQLALGVGLFIPRTIRPALVMSIFWAAGVWYFGEGLGGIFGGAASLLDGAPGAALLYGVLAVAAWPPSHLDDGHTEPPPRWTVKAWSLLWIGFGALTLFPANDSARGTASPIVANITMVPAPLASVDRLAASAVPALGPLVVPAFVLTMVSIGVLATPRSRWRVGAVGAGCGLALVAWVVGQSLGQLGSGQATDPNAAPLVTLLGLVALSAAGAPTASWAPTSKGRARWKPLPGPHDELVSAEKRRLTA